jgi:prolyl oligopeptidase
MVRLFCLFVASTLFLFSPLLIAETMSTPSYPETRRGDIVETHFGEVVADPYRWLENDVREDQDVAAWVEAQNKVTQVYLDALPQRAWFEEKISALLDYERFGIPLKAGGRYFYTRNTGLLNQAQLFVRKGLKGKPKLLLDPNTWAEDGATALDAWKPSDDGRHLLYSVQDGGSDWRILRVLDVRSGKQFADEVRWVKFSNLAWVGSEGFLYSRFPEPEEGTAFQGLNYNQMVYFHRLGTGQGEDELVYATPDNPDYNHTAEVTQDGKYAVITSSVGTDARYELHVIDLGAGKEAGWAARALVEGFENDWRLVDGMGSNLWFVTNWQAPRNRLVSVDLETRKSEWREVVSEQLDILERAAVIGRNLVMTYLHDASTRALIYTLGGTSVRELSLNGIGSATGFKGRPGDPETFYSHTSFNRPPAIYRMDMETGESTPFAEPDLAFDPNDYDVDQRFFTSKDGTRVPMFVVRSKASAAGSPRQAGSPFREVPMAVC